MGQWLHDLESVLIHIRKFLSIKIKRINNTRKNFTRSGRCCTYGMITVTIISPLYVSHVLTITCHFGPTTTPVQGLCCESKDLAIWE